MKRIAFIIVFLLVLSFQNFVFSQDNKNKKDTVTIEVQVVPEPEMYVDSNRLYVKNATVGKRVEIYTIIGNKIREIPLTSKEGIFDLNLPRAIYIFKLEGVIKKFVVI